MHNQKKDNNKFKNKKQPELTKIKLYGSLTTKELKKKHSSGRRCRDWQPGGKDSWQAAAGGPGKVAAGGLGGPTFACR